MSTRVLMVRHGQSEWNALGRWQGQADPPLSDLGRRQAQAVGRALPESVAEPVGAVFSSDLQRAAETAEIIRVELDVSSVVIDRDLRERDAGEWSGLTRAEIDECYPGYLPPVGENQRQSAFSPSLAGQTPRRPPGWEPDELLLERALSALAGIHVAVGDGTALAVTHGGLIYTLEHHLESETEVGPGRGRRNPGVERLANGGGRWVFVNGTDFVLGGRVLLIDDEDTPVTVPNQI